MGLFDWVKRKGKKKGTTYDSGMWDDDDRDDEIEELEHDVDDSENIEEWEPEEVDDEEVIEDEDGKHGDDEEEEEYREPELLEEIGDSGGNDDVKINYGGGGLLNTVRRNKEETYQLLRKRITDDEMRSIDNILRDSTTLYEIYEKMDANHISLMYLVALDFVTEEDLSAYQAYKNTGLDTKKLMTDDELESATDSDYENEVLQAGYPLPDTNSQTEGDNDVDIPITYDIQISKTEELEDTPEQGGQGENTETTEEVAPDQVIEQITEEDVALEALKKLKEFGMRKQVIVDPVDPPEEVQVEEDLKHPEDTLQDELTVNDDLNEDPDTKPEEAGNYLEEETDKATEDDSTQEERALPEENLQEEELQLHYVPEFNTKPKEPVLATQTERSVYVVGENIELPTYTGYQFYKVVTFDDIRKYSASKDNLLVITNQIPESLLDGFGDWLNGVTEDGDKYRMVTLGVAPVTHESIEEEIELTQEGLDNYFEEYKASRYGKTVSGGFFDIKTMFGDEE